MWEVELKLVLVINLQGGGGGETQQPLIKWTVFEMSSGQHIEEGG